MSNKTYGDHRGIRQYKPTAELSCVHTRGQIMLKHFRLPQNEVWILYPDGRTARLYKGTPIPRYKLETQSARWVFTMALMKRNTNNAGATEVDKVRPCPLSEKYPDLVAFLSEHTFADGEKRTPGSMTIFLADEGGLRVCLNDKESGETAFVSGGSLSEILKRCEEGISTGRLDWRTARRKTGKK